MTNSTLRTASNLDFSNKAFESTLATIILDSCRHNPVLVEGERDENILKKFFCDKAHFIYTGSKSNVIKIISRVFKIKTNIIGICDRDYETVSIARPHVFYYDKNNLEMMLVNDDRVFGSEIFISAGFNKDNLISSKQKTFKILYPKSVLRLLDYEKKYSLTFDDYIPSDDLLIRQSFEQNILCVKTNLLNKALFLPDDKRSAFVSEYASRVECQYDYQDITQGHDFVNIFRKIVTNLGEERFYSLISSAYTKSFFENTLLYHSIKSYEAMEAMTLLI